MRIAKERPRLCATDTCNRSSGCLNTANNAVCTDNNACTTDTCSNISGCAYANVPNNTLCSNATGRCVTGTCTPGTCSDSVIETGLGETCDGGNGCSDCENNEDNAMAGVGGQCLTVTNTGSASCTGSASHINVGNNQGNNRFCNRNASHPMAWVTGVICCKN